jgi:proteasome-associated ATPase
VYLTDDLPLDRQWIDQHGGDRKKACADLVEYALSAIFSRIDENRLLSIRLRNGQNKVLYRSDLISGAILASIVQRAKEQAIDRMIAAGGAEHGGMTLDDLVNSVHAEFREGEMLPPDDAAEEWLKLLDHHPEQVVGVSSFRRGRQSEERLVSQII